MSSAAEPRPELRIAHEWMISAPLDQRVASDAPFTVPPSYFSLT